MRRLFSALRWLLSPGMVFCLASPTSYSLPADSTQEIGALMTTLFERGQFNGAILVAKRGKIVYRNGFGKGSFQTGADFTPETRSNIGSVTKQFTAMAIMILAERTSSNMTTLSRNTFQSSLVPLTSTM